MMPRGDSGKSSRINWQSRSSSILPVPSVSTWTLTGSANADRIGQLHLAAIGQPRGHDVLGDVAGHVGGTAVDLGRILAAERAATVAAPAAVGVDDDLPAGQAAVAVRAADHEAAGRVDVVGDVAASTSRRAAPA